MENTPGSVMIRSTITLLLFLSLAATALAADRTIKLAKADQSATRVINKKPALPVVTETYEYYEIRGDSEKDLRCQMTQNGCKWDDGRKYDSVTKWHVKWDYDYDREPDSCAAASFKATVEITFRMPKWVHGEHPVLALAEKWDRYMQNLVLHENGHRDLTIAAVADLSRAVSELPPANTCADVDRSVQALSRQYMKKLNHDQKAYDADTVHGVKQGALFP